MAYPTRWFAPKAGSLLDSLIDTTPATRHCNGTPLTAADTVAMIRVDATTTGAMDWNANGFFAPPDPAVFSQDINFNGKTDDPARDGTFKGFNDWQHMDLRQTASRRNKNGLSLEIDYTDVSGDEQPSFGNEQPSFGDEQPAFGDEQPGIRRRAAVVRRRPRFRNRDVGRNTAALLELHDHEPSHRPAVGSASGRGRDAVSGMESDRSDWTDQPADQRSFRPCS